MNRTKQEESKTDKAKEAAAANKKKRRYKAKKLVLNVSQTKYNVIRYVAKQFKMRLSGAPYMADYSNPNDEWDLLWTDGTV